MKVDGSDEIKLSTLSRPLTVSIGTKQCENEQLSAKEVIGMQINAGLSDRQLFAVL